MSKKQVASLNGKYFIVTPVAGVKPATRQTEDVPAPVIKLPHWKEGEGFGGGVVINQKKGNQT